MARHYAVTIYDIMIHESSQNVVLMQHTFLNGVTVSAIYIDTLVQLITVWITSIPLFI